MGFKTISTRPIGVEDIGNYSINLPNNDQYKIYIISYFNCEIANPPQRYATNCTAGSFDLNTTPNSKVELNVGCGENANATTFTTTTMSTASSSTTEATTTTSSSSATTTRVSTQVTSVCLAHPTTTTATSSSST